MVRLIGNCSKVIDWNAVIKDCENTEPEYIGPSHSRADNLPGLDEIANMWEKAGYKNLDQGGTVGWDMYIPGKQFDQSAIEKFCEYFEIENYSTAWISSIKVGNFAPIHWDVHDDEEEMSKLPDIPRYHCHIGKPKFGHIFIVDEKCFYNQQQGATYRWESRKLWHAGTNMGLETKYILNLW